VDNIHSTARHEHMWFGTHSMQNVRARREKRNRDASRAPQINEAFGLLRCIVACTGPLAILRSSSRRFHTHQGSALPAQIETSRQTRGLGWVHPAALGGCGSLGSAHRMRAQRDPATHPTLQRHRHRKLRRTLARSQRRVNCAVARHVVLICCRRRARARS
jgi:hypothetical protein